MEIKINITSLEEAGRVLDNLGSRLNKANFMFGNMNLIEESSGVTFTSVNEAYRELKYIESSIAVLIEKTKIVLENTGIAFQETDNNLAKSITNNLSIPNKVNIPKFNYNKQPE
ncbi:hypothetical protein NNC19_08020 [Clostridium sp. SHJSY1]|uniref:hypothetical protein n=1 Tax=Clostridium sp. SHJSY1 TaxID=2942483 RepID=UPI002874893C|nr:hypothetical protein [Clostridium sp. SHJSY1]MDS0525620.1 hypothetical protein [Clostridium sp. SHJSY1]